MMSNKIYLLEHELLTELNLDSLILGHALDQCFKNRYIFLDHLLNFDSHEIWLNEKGTQFQYTLQFWPLEYLMNLNSWDQFKNKPFEIDAIYSSFDELYTLMTNCYYPFLDSYKNNEVDPLAIPLEAIEREIKKLDETRCDHQET